MSETPLKKLSEEIKAELKKQLRSKETKEAIKQIKQAEDSGTFEVVISTKDVDRQGESINPEGWDLTFYKMNPVVLWAHDYLSLPIGITEEIEVKDGKLIAKGKFAPEHANPFAQQVRRLYDLGIVRATSVGFIAKETEGNEISKAELLEFSFVPVPANPFALSLMRTNNLNPKEYITKGILIKQEEPQTPKPEEPETQEEAKEPSEIVEENVDTLELKLKSAIAEDIQNFEENLNQSLIEEIENEEEKKKQQEEITQTLEPIIEKIEQEAEKIIETAIENVKEPLSETVEETVNEAEKQEEPKTEEIKEEIEESAKEELQKTEEEINDGLEEVLDSIKEEITDELPETIEEKQIEDIVSEEIETLKSDIQMSVSEVIQETAEKIGEETAQAVEEKMKKRNAITKSPACRQEGETIDECVNRKIPEILEENPDMEQDQAVAIAFSMCEVSCEEKSKQKKKNIEKIGAELQSMQAKIDDIIVQTSRTILEIIETEYPQQQEVEKINRRLKPKGGVRGDYVPTRRSAKQRSQGVGLYASTESFDEWLTMRKVLRLANNATSEALEKINKRLREKYGRKNH